MSARSMRASPDREVRAEAQPREATAEIVLRARRTLLGVLLAPEWLSSAFGASLQGPEEPGEPECTEPQA